MAKAENNQDLNQKVDALLSSRRGPREMKDDHPQKQIKYTVEYRDEQKNVVSRWTYDLKKFPNGPILVENFGPEYSRAKKSTL